MRISDWSSDVCSSDLHLVGSYVSPLMIYIFHLLDKPGGIELRQRMRPDHKAYLAAVADRIAFAGPLLAEDGATLVGSMLAIDFESREAALPWQANEPFNTTGERKKVV